MEEIPVAGIDEISSSSASHPDETKAPENGAFLPYVQKRSSWLGACMRVSGLFANTKDDLPLAGMEELPVAESNRTSTNLASHPNEGEALEGTAQLPQVQ